MPVFGTQSKYGVPISFHFAFDGVDVDWGTTKLHSVSDLSNSSDPINNKRKISDLRASFIDKDQDIWGSMGNGTGAFDKAFNLTTRVGGSMAEQTVGLRNVMKKVLDDGANTYTVHQGNITEVSKKGPLTTIHSQNLLNKLQFLKWQMPVRDNPATFVVASGTQGSVTGLALDDVVVNFNTVGTDADFYGIITGTLIDFSGYQGTGLYDTSAGTGIVDFLGGSYSFRDMAFHYDFPKVKLKSAGNIITWPNGTFDSSHKYLYPLQLIRLEGDPVAVLRHCLFGKMVGDYFDDDTNRGTDTFNRAQNVTAFQVFEQTINPDDDLVEDYISDIIQTVNALFYTSTTNRFEFQPYGPRDLQATLDTLGSADLLEAEYQNDINDWVNRIQLKFNWDFDNNTFQNSSTGSLSSWTPETDRPLILDSKWIRNGNQANNSVLRQLARFKNTSPKVNFTTTLQQAGRDLGSLVELTDSDLNMSAQIVQIIEYNKGFGNSKTIQFRALDGEALYRKRGYAKWEDSAIAAAVSGTSESGFSDGTLGGPEGTVHNINETLYGSNFRWW